jgi:hypothetical protein
MTFGMNVELFAFHAHLLLCLVLQKKGFLKTVMNETNANVRRYVSLLVSKGGRSAKHAAEHIQQCMSTACQKTGAQQQQQQQQQQDHQPLGQLLQHRSLDLIAQHRM